MKKFFNLNQKELRVFSKLNSPAKIQDFINQIPINFEKNGETYLSPREVLKQNRAHCMEGAVLAASILWYHGQKPWLLDLQTTKEDEDHVVAVFKHKGFYGAISKTNHAVLRYREPIYKTIRELALSYFHEYFTNEGKKTLRSYSSLVDLSKIKDQNWITTQNHLDHLVDKLISARHFPILSKSQIKSLRAADNIETKAGKIKEY